jgi:hypothetical protein
VLYIAVNVVIVGLAPGGCVSRVEPEAAQGRVQEKVEGRGRFLQHLRRRPGVHFMILQVGQKVVCNSISSKQNTGPYLSLTLADVILGFSDCFFKHPIPWRDSISRPLMAGGDDTTRPWRI